MPRSPARRRCPVEEVQAQLGADEALVLFLDTPEAKPTPEETFIWVVTKTDMRWVRSGSGHAGAHPRGAGAALRARCDGMGQDRPCAELTGGRPTPRRTEGRQAAALRSCPRARALQGAVRPGGRPHQGQASADRAVRPADAIAVPGAGDGAAARRRWPKGAAWLIRDHALTVLPAVSSLKALRRVARPSAAASR